MRRSTIGGRCPTHGPFDAMYASCPYCAQAAYLRAVAANRSSTRPSPRMQFRQSQPELPPLGYFIINRPTPWRGAVAQVRHGTTIGQNPRCHLRLADPYVANWHAQIVLHVQRERSQFYIRDLGSHSGIFHNRQRLTAWGCLSQDDTVQIGSYEFVFKTLT